MEALVVQVLSRGSGHMPGSRLILQRKRRTFVVRVGETKLALELEIAREILVRRV